MENDQRVTELEIRIAELEHANEQISRIATDQWKEIENLKAALKKVAERLIALEEDGAGPAPVTKPPHY